MTKLMKILYGKEEYHQELSKNQSKMNLNKTIKCFYFSEKKKKKKNSVTQTFSFQKTFGQ